MAQFFVKPFLNLTGLVNRMVKREIRQKAHIKMTTNKLDVFSLSYDRLALFATLVYLIFKFTMF